MEVQLDTVRALHQTVVSLRAALEASKSELNDLRTRYETHAVKEESTLKNLETEAVDITNNNNTTPDIVTQTDDNDNSNETLETVRENVQYAKKIRFEEDDAAPRDDERLQENVSYETTIELESKYDVTIKVLSDKGKKESAKQPIEVTAGADCNSDNDTLFTDALHIQIETEENVQMAGSGDALEKQSEKFNIQVKITSEENLAMMEEPARKESASDNLNVEADDISARSISEGENSVFSDTGETLVGDAEDDRNICEQDSISGNDSEEVDDIELIFTTDDTKELGGYQEDLVSIVDEEKWTNDDVSTPVLVKFNMLDPEKSIRSRGHPSHKESTDNFENENQENATIQDVLADCSDSKSHLQRDRSAEEREARDKIATDRIKFKKGFLKSSTSGVGKSSLRDNRPVCESSDSLNFENQKSFSFDTKSSSLDRGSSVDIVTRELSFDQKEESLDQLDVLRTTTRTKYSVCIETDISKCGVMEDDTFPTNLNLRRNTCPNPFQYKPLSHREAMKGFPVRPMLNATNQKSHRRSSAAQTDISALPNHWRSDTHLAKKIFPLGLTTLPGKISTGGTICHLTPPTPVRPTRLSEESRRVLLSDIGFTSMVPELSRSAEPVWGALGALQTPSTSTAQLPLCCALHGVPYYGSVPSSPTRQDSSNTNSKYWSKSSMQRSISGRMGEVTPSSNRVSFIDQPMRGGWRGSMPELRKNLTCCSHAGHRFRKRGFSKIRLAETADSGDSTEELMDEADFFLKTSIDCMATHKNFHSEDFHPTRFSRPYLPTVPRQLRLGHLVKIITPHGRITIGKVRYVGVAGGPVPTGTAPTIYIGVQLKNKSSIGGDGTFHGRRYFHCEPGCSVFVPFSKVVVAWADL